MRTTIDNLRRLKASGKPNEWHEYEVLGRNLSREVWRDISTWSRDCNDAREHLREFRIDLPVAAPLDNLE